MSAAPNLKLVGDASAASAAGYCAPKARIDELRRRRTIRCLFRDINSGKWKKVLLDLNNTQHKFRDLAQHSGKVEALLAKVNLVRLAFRFHATVAAANPVECIVADGNDEQAMAIAEIRDRVLFDTLFHRTIRAVNIDAEAPVRVSVGETGTIVTLDDPDRTLAVGPNGPDGQPTVWERRWLCERPGFGSRPKVYLRVERHRVDRGVGIIEQEAYTSATTDRPVSDVLVCLEELRRVPLADAFERGASLPAERVETGAGYAAIVRFVADMEDGEPAWMLTKDDLDIVDEAAAAFSRLSRAHDLHSQPLLRVPSGMMDPKTGTVALSQDAIIDDDKVVEYIAQNFDLGQMLDLMDRVLGLMLVMLQMSQALLGYKMGGGAAPDSYDKLRLESTSTLARAEQTAAYCAPAAGRLFTIATQIDSRQPMRGYAVGPVTVEMRPELPKDRVELARELNEMLSGPKPLIAHRDALARLHGERNADAMMERIREDQAAEARNNAASIFMGEPAGGVA